VRQRQRGRDNDRSAGNRYTGIQVYNEKDGTGYTGNGDVKIRYYDTNGNSQEYVGSAGTITNGKLTLNLPETVKEQYLEPIGKSVPDGTTASPKDAKVLYVYRFYVPDASGYGPSLSYSKDDESSEDIIYYVYSSTAATITGSVTEADEDKETTYTETYNLNLKKGWNAVYEHWDWDANTENGDITTDGSAVPSGLKWILSS
jgi:hypothetical protein